MIIVTTGIPMTQQYVLMSACWLELDSEEDGVLLEYHHPQNKFDNDIFKYIQNMKYVYVDICYSVSKFLSTCINAIQGE